MANKTELFLKSHSKKNVPDVKPGDTVRVHQKMPASAKASAGKKEEKAQIFEGLIIAKKHGRGISATITVRKVVAGVGVEKIFPIHSPNILKIEIKKKGKVRRAKLYYLRTAKGKKAKLKRKYFVEAIGEPSIEEKPSE